MTPAFFRRIYRKSQILSMVRVVSFELSLATRAALEEVLGVAVSPSNPSCALDALVQICGHYANRRSGGDASSLRNELRSKNIQLLPLRAYQEDIAKLQTATLRVLEDLEHYGSIRVADDGGALKTIVVTRQCVDAIVTSAELRSFLIVGDPGSGKSGALQAAAKRLQAKGHEVVVLAVDQLLGSTSDQLRAELELSHPIVEVLTEWQPATTPIILIDALDASRGAGSEGAISQLLRDVMKRAPHWHVVASIRKFDLRYGVKFQGLFDGKPVNAAYSDPDFGTVAHLNVPELAEHEIADVCNQWAKLDEVLNASGERFRSLLRSPFNLYLLAQILDSTSSRENPAKTQLDLLTQYWKHRVDIDPAVELKNQYVLRLLVQAMLAERRLTTDIMSVPPAQLDDLTRLLGHAVLYQPRGTTRIGFAHHMLFDFSLAKLKLLSEGPHSIGREIAAISEEMLLVAPAAMIAFWIAWETDSTRVTFWNVAIELTETPEIGAFIRSLPAKVAVESARNPEDVAPLLELMASSSHRDSAAFLVKHIFGVILAGVVPGVPRFGNAEDPWFSFDPTPNETIRALPTDFLSSADCHNAVIPNIAPVPSTVSKGRTAVGSMVQVSGNYRISNLS